MWYFRTKLYNTNTYYCKAIATVLSFTINRKYKTIRRLIPKYLSLKNFHLDFIFCTHKNKSRLEHLFISYDS